MYKKAINFCCFEDAAVSQNGCCFSHKRKIKLHNVSAGMENRLDYTIIKKYKDLKPHISNRGFQYLHRVGVAIWVCSNQSVATNLS